MNQEWISPDSWKIVDERKVIKTKYKEQDQRETEKTIY
jgi:hypothetical protein